MNGDHRHARHRSARCIAGDTDERGLLRARSPRQDHCQKNRAEHTSTNDGVHVHRLLLRAATQLRSGRRPSRSGSARRYCRFDTVSQHCQLLHASLEQGARHAAQRMKERSVHSAKMRIMRSRITAHAGDDRAREQTCSISRARRPHKCCRDADRYTTGAQTPQVTTMSSPAPVNWSRMRRVDETRLEME